MRGKKKKMENKKYNEYYYGKKVSKYGLKNGYVDYGALSDVVFLQKKREKNSKKIYAGTCL